MKLFSETSNISQMWENSENIQSKFKGNKTVLDNIFYSNEEFDTFSRKIFGSPNDAENILSPDTERPEGSFLENPSAVNKIRNDKIKNLRHTSLKLPKETKSMYKQSLQRGKSDTGPNRNARRHTDHDISSLYCRTEFKIPGEFLFCSRADQNNTFASIYRKISSAGNLRRSLSTGTIKVTISPKCKLSRATYSPETSTQSPDIKYENHNAQSQSCVIRNTCKKMYMTTNVDEKEIKRQSREILAVELQNILDTKGDLLSKDKKLEKQSLNNSTYNNRKNVTKPSSNDSKDVLDGTKTKTNRRSQSCKGMLRRRSNLFNISKYLKDRNTQRSKSFATIRQFSSSKPGKSKNMSLDLKVDNLKIENDTFSSENYYDLSTHNYILRNVEQSPIKTTLNFDINDTDSRGNSCLHHASSQGDTTTLKYLLEQGGNVWVKNDDHCLPIDIARNFQTAKLLSSATLFYSEHSGQRNERNIMQTSKLNIAL